MELRIGGLTDAASLICFMAHIKPLVRIEGQSMFNDTRSKQKYEIKTIKQFETIRCKDESFIVITDVTNPNKIHWLDCRWVIRKNFEKKLLKIDVDMGDIIGLITLNTLIYNLK